MNQDLKRYLKKAETKKYLKREDEKDLIKKTKEKFDKIRKNSLFFRNF